MTLSYAYLTDAIARAFGLESSGDIVKDLETILQDVIRLRAEVAKLSDLRPPDMADPRHPAPTCWTLDRHETGYCHVRDVDDNRILAECTHAFADIIERGQRAAAALVIADFILDEDVADCAAAGTGCICDGDNGGECDYHEGQRDMLARLRAKVDKEPT